MIYESTPWKRELRRSARMLSLWCGRAHTERGYFLLEKHVFLSAFVVRKLFDSHKVTDTLRLQPIEVRRFPAKMNVLGGIASVFGKSFLSDAYELETGQVHSASMRDLVNQIIHSFFFVIDSAEDREISLFFNSDKTKGDFVVEVPMSRYVKLLKATADDHVRSYSLTVDRLTGKTKVALT